MGEAMLIAFSTMANLQILRLILPGHYQDFVYLVFEFIAFTFIFVMRFVILHRAGVTHYTAL